MTVAELDWTGGRGRRLDRFRWDVLDRDFAKQGEISPEQGAQVTFSTGGIGRTIRGVRLDPDDAAALDVTEVRLRPCWVDRDGVAYPLGVYRPVQAVTVHLADEGRTWGGKDRAEWDLADESVRLSARTNRAQSWPREYPIVDALTEWASAVDLLAEVVIDPTTEALGDPVSFPRGEATWQEVGDALCSAGGMLPPHFDNTGQLRCRVCPAWESAIPDQNYSTLDGRVVFAGFQTTDTFLESPNVWYAINDKPGPQRIVGRWPLPASAPNSVEQVGAEIPEYVNGTYRSQAAANEAARIAGSAAFADIGEASLATPLDPRHDLYALVTVDGDRYREVQWSATLAPGADQTHDLRRVYE